MKKFNSLFIFLFSFFSTYISFAQPINSKEWSDYMQHNRLYWDSLGTDFYDGIIAGNGLIGVNMYREGSNAIRFDVGRTDVTDQRPHYPDSMFTQQLVSHPRLPIGRMMIRTAGKILSASIFLDIYNAEARGTIKTTKGIIEIYFTVPSGEDVIHIEANELKSSEKLLCEWIGEEAMTPRISFGSVKPETYKYKANPHFTIKDTLGYGVCYQPLLFDGEYASVYRHTIGNKIHTIDISIGYSATKKGVVVKEALGNLKKFYSKPYATVLASHKKWWNNYFQQSFISIPDKNIESYYWLQLYKLASASREDKPMIDLMGPWFTSKTPWPAIWWNLNTQLTYSPLFASNHLELTKPLFDLINKNKQNLINNVPLAWRKDAAAIGRISTFDLIAPLNQHDLRKGQFEPGDLIWVMLYYYKYYQYTGDLAELNDKIFPLMKRSVNYLIHLLEKDATGVYHLPKSHSPEFADAEDAHYSLAGLIWGLQTLIKTNDILKRNDPDKNNWSTILQQLTPLHTNETGFMLGKDVALTASHRHYSHLMAIYPYRLLNMNDPAHRKMTIKSIEHWQSMPSALAGYSYTGASAMYSLLGDGNKAYDYLNRYIKRHAEPGGLYAESGPCFETPMAFATSLLEMLIQSDDGLIKIFPAVPETWKEISFSKLGAEGAFLVDAIRFQGKLQEVTVKSLKGNRCTLEVEAGNEYFLTSSVRGLLNPDIINENSKTFVSFETKIGETLTLVRKGAPAAKDLLVHFKENKYYWGLNSAYEKKSMMPVK
jgi:alpha-L-fucosidase 2